MSYSATPFKWLLLSAVFLLGVWFLSNELVYSMFRDRSAEPLLRTAVLIIHLLVTLPLLLLPPVQFSRRIRARWPTWHRYAGRFYLSAAMLAAVTAIYLGFSFEDVGRRVPLCLFALLWLVFSIQAWRYAHRRAFTLHEKFVIRSYTVALAFVLVRLMGEFQQPLLGFIPQGEVRDVTREWLSFVLPLLAVECWFAWKMPTGVVKR